MDGLAWAPPASDAAFEYRSLDTTSQTIRLICLSRNSAGTIEGRLEHFELSKAPRYYALSYRWDHHCDTKSIPVNECVFRVRPNLYDFLEIYKERKLDRWLWVDQICIDQTSTLERNHQVELMADVFQNAHRVIIWLDSDLSRVKAPRLVGDAKSRSCTKQCREADHRKDLKNPRYLTDVCTWIYLLLGHEYWTRTWIVQEVLLARKKIIWYYGCEVTWRQLRSYAIHFQNMTSSILRFLVNTRSMEVPQLTLDRVLYETFRSGCEDIRDTVYAIQGLLPRHQRVPVDYHKSPAEVMVDTALVLLISDLKDFSDLNCLNLLSKVLKTGSFQTDQWTALRWTVRSMRITSDEEMLDAHSVDRIKKGLTCLVRNNDGVFKEWSRLMETTYAV